MNQIDEFMKLSSEVHKGSWNGVFLDPTERFVIDKVLGMGDISINASTIKVLQSATARQRRCQRR